MQKCEEWKGAHTLSGARRKRAGEPREHNYVIMKACHLKNKNPGGLTMFDIHFLAVSRTACMENHD